MTRSSYMEAESFSLCALAHAQSMTSNSQACWSLRKGESSTLSLCKLLWPLAHLAQLHVRMVDAQPAHMDWLSSWVMCTVCSGQSITATLIDWWPLLKVIPSLSKIDCTKIAKEWINIIRSKIIAFDHFTLTHSHTRELQSLQKGTEAFQALHGNHLRIQTSHSDKGHHSQSRAENQNRKWK